MKSTLRNMVLVLLVITAVAAAAVGYVYKLTAEPIAQAKLQKKLDALGQVLPAFDNQPTDDMRTVQVDGMDINIYTASEGGRLRGYAVESVTNQGFGGTIKIMAGFDTEGNIINIEVLEHAETPGLGAKLADRENPVKVSFAGKNPADLNMAVRKDGGDIDAITASTISSKAYIDAVGRAYRALADNGYLDKALDTASGATKTNN